MSTMELRRALKEALYQAELLAVTTQRRRHQRYERKLARLLAQVKDEKPTRREGTP